MLSRMLQPVPAPEVMVPAVAARQCVRNLPSLSLLEDPLRAPYHTLIPLPLFVVAVEGIPASPLLLEPNVVPVVFPNGLPAVAPPANRRLSGTGEILADSYMYSPSNGDPEKC